MKQIDEITTMLEKGVKTVFTSDNYKRYLDVMSKFYRYSVNNCILIMMQCPDASLVAGYKKWQTDFKRQVKKGARAIRILAPTPHKKTVEVKTADGISEEEVSWMSYRPVPVFDISQTEGEEIAAICKPLESAVKGFQSLYSKLVALSPVPVSFGDTGAANGYYSDTMKAIVIKPDMSEAMTLKTTIHEVAHAMLHCKDGSEAKATRQAKEVQAESVAYIVCNALGIDTSDYSFEYVASWSGEEDSDILVNSMNTIKSTATTLIDTLKVAA